MVPSARERAPLWHPSMMPPASVAGDGGGPPLGRSRAGPRAPVRQPARIDETVLARLGLKKPPDDPRLLAEFLQAEDTADAEADSDAFGRGIRRALRLNMAFSAKLHRRAGEPWTVWVRKHFKAGYECYRRYHRAAELQVGLLSRGLPPLAGESQARVLAGLRWHERFWEALADDSFKEGFPSGRELADRLRTTLGLPSAPSSSPRIRLHRSLKRILESAGSPDEAPLAEALGLLRQAVALLERGGPA